MIAPDDTHRVEPKSNRTRQGWTSLHSWIFLAIVAVGLLVIGWQNRYFYLSPLGLGKAYRIDKLFGGIQEFDPSNGWVRAQIPTGPPPQPPTSMNEPPMQPGSPPSMSMNMPPSVLQPPSSIPATPATPALPQPPKVATEESAPTPQVATKEAAEEPHPQAASSTTQVAETQEAKPAAVPAELTEKEKLDEFHKSFPDFGKDEFQLANDDLYPDWKKRVAPDGTWEEFLEVYGQFVQWWNDQGSPPEPGFKLWKEFSKSLKR